MPDAIRIDRLGIIGAGNMAEALARGLIGARLVQADQIQACDPDPHRREVFRALGADVSADNAEAAGCPVVLLSVKPQVLDEVVKVAGANMGPQTLAISIAAGVRTNRIAGLVPAGVRIVRVMPNTPLLVGSGVAGVARGPKATDEDLALVLGLFSAAGAAHAVDEERMDAVTAVSGSGPAYVFRFCEALEAAARSQGLDPDLARRLARGTVVGAARLLAESAEEAKELRERVTSPGGTTAAALQVFESRELERIVCEAVAAAARRSDELARGEA